MTPLICALLAVQPAPAAAPAYALPAAPATGAAAATLTPRQRLLADGERLLAQAQAERPAWKPLRGAPTRADLDTSAAGLRRDLDTLAGTGETDSLRLQAAMDRLAKAMSTLSNLMKARHDVAMNSIRNMK
ncbi:MAG: hypothetical protein JOZ90_09440 [Alphaproteobacteria bacterium]|nr:hypothetical protein [Alphaproteobacteria bacterium]MBV9371861.1 hypothetical protein [Alphaproteobacteria bacterium]MBV9901308.1 hypothetical protein [Alphaproteobacteria bacterium]